MSKSESKLLVIGAGLPRTGTLSLSKALEILLDGKCYHMQPFFEKGTDYDIKHWNDALVKYRIIPTCMILVLPSIHNYLKPSFYIVIWKT